MKRIPIALIILASVFIWQGCCNSNLYFSGKVVDKKGSGIPGAIVKVDGKEEKADKSGEFKICVDRADKLNKYVLTASKLEFGFFSKVYADTSTHLVITLSKATVVEVDPNRDISVQDTNPDITGPTFGTSPVANPLDTIPFVYNAQGNLIGFKKPQSLIDSRNAIANFQPPVLGAKIEIPAGSLVIERKEGRKGEEERKPEGSVQVSVNTIDVYAPGAMPGNYTVDLGNDQRAYMQTYGAANIEAYYKGQPLQLGTGKTASLTIPIDTLSIISKRTLPTTIPLLVYNITTGYWNESGSATLNASKDAYEATISHFSTYNMDLEKVTPSCLQLCTELTTGSSLHIFPDPASGLADMTWLNTGVLDCPDPANPSAVTDCSAYEITLANTSGVMNIENNVMINIDVINGGSPVASYVVNSGPQPTGFASPDDYQKCNWNDCGGPFKITDSPQCWENTDGSGNYDGTMGGPLLAVTRSGGGTGDDFTFSWLYIGAIVGGVITNGSVDYKIEYSTDINFASPLEVLFGGTNPVVTSSNYIEGPHSVTISGLSPVVYFRVLFSTDGGTTYKYGVKSCVNCFFPPAGNPRCVDLGSVAP